MLSSNCAQIKLIMDETYSRSICRAGASNVSDCSPLEIAVATKLHAQCQKETANKGDIRFQYWYDDCDK